VRCSCQAPVVQADCAIVVSVRANAPAGQEAVIELCETGVRYLHLIAMWAPR
jgi:hypothetical protein